MTTREQKQIRFSNSPIRKKIKMDGRTVVSRALIKENASNLVPKLHVRAGDMVMLMSGSEECGRGKTGKVLNVFPREGKLVVEGLNIITRATKSRSAMVKSGQIKKEGKIYASRVMLFCLGCKKPTRIAHKFLESGKKTRICKHCSEAFDA